MKPFNKDKFLLPVIIAALFLVFFISGLLDYNRQTQAAVHSELIKLAKADEAVAGLIAKLLDYSIMWETTIVLDGEEIKKGGRLKEGAVSNFIEDVDYLAKTNATRVRIESQLDCVIDSVQPINPKKNYITSVVRIPKEEQESFKRFNPGKKAPQTRAEKVLVKDIEKSLRSNLSDADFLFRENNLANRVRALELISQATEEDWFRYMKETYPSGVVNHKNFNNYAYWAGRHATGKLTINDWVVFLSKDIAAEALEKNPELMAVIRREAAQLANNPLLQHLKTTLDESSKALSLAVETRNILKKPRGIYALKSFFQKFFGVAEGQKPGFGAKFGAICNICETAISAPTPTIQELNNQLINIIQQLKDAKTNIIISDDIKAKIPEALIAANNLQTALSPFLINGVQDLIITALVNQDLIPVQYRSGLPDPATISSSYQLFLRTLPPSLNLPTFPTLPRLPGR